MFEALTAKKKQLDRFRPLPDALVRNLDDWFRVELTYTSNAIEGNTLTRRETALVVEKGLTVGGKSLVEHLEASNHARALDWVKQQIKRRPQDLSERNILYIHDVILKGINDDHAGQYRNVPVRISGSAVILPNPRKVPDLMADFAQWLNGSVGLHPVELAAEAHYRSARLLMNMILLMEGYPCAIIRKRDRLAYISSLEKAQLGGSKNDYLKIISQAVDRSLDIYLKAVEGETAASESDEGRLLKIGELAKLAGENVSTIRHWTKEGLLEVAEITASGYQLYAPEMLSRTERIKALKKQRFTLSEIRKEL
jgi:Fic family protein